MRRGLSIAVGVICVVLSLSACGDDGGSDSSGNGGSGAAASEAPEYAEPATKKAALAAFDGMFSGMKGDNCDGGTVDVIGAQVKPTPAEWFAAGHPEAAPPPDPDDPRPALYFTTTFCGPADDPALAGDYDVRLAGFQHTEGAADWLEQFDTLARSGQPFSTSPSCTATATKAESTVLTGDVGDGAVDITIDETCPSEEALPPEATANVEPDRWSFAAAGPWVVAASVMQCGQTEEFSVPMGGGTAQISACTVSKALADQHQHIVETLLDELAT